MTTEKLLQIREEIKKMNLSPQEKSLWWLTACWGLAGSFRIHELLAQEPSTYDPTTNLMTSDVRLSTISM